MIRLYKKDDATAFDEFRSDIFKLDENVVLDYDTNTVTIDGTDYYIYPPYEPKTNYVGVVKIHR